MSEAKQTDATAAIATDSGKVPFHEKFTFRVCENPQPPQFVLESLAGLLIDLAEQDGTLTPIEGRPPALKAAA